MDLNWKIFELTYTNETNDSTFEIIGILRFRSTIIVLENDKLKHINYLRVMKAIPTYN